MKETTPSCGGIFNVRVSPYIHLKALERSKERGITLNKYIRNALERDLSLEK
jgi:predicted HicB family RNase H-like nuclease